MTPPTPKPERIQLRRTKGWRKPAGAIVVARPSRWGNPYRAVRNRVPVGPEHPGCVYRGGQWWVVVATNKWGHETGTMFGAWTDRAEAVAFSVEMFRLALVAQFTDIDGDLTRESYLGGLRGHDLACWCPLDQPCHADVLLELANGELA